MSTPAQPVFDPDAFMASRQGGSSPAFDPDAFMASRQQQEKPGLLSRTSEALLGVSHPGDQLMSEVSELYHKPLAAFSEAGKRVFQTLTGAQFPTIEGIKEDIANPVGRSKEAFKNVSGVPGMLIHPAKAAENITGSRSLTDDLGNLNYAAAVGDIVGGAANLGLTFADPGKAAAEAAEETAAKAATEETAKVSVPKSVPIQPKPSALGAVAGDFAKTLGIVDPAPESLMTWAVKPLA